MCRMSLVSPKSGAAGEEGRVGRQDSHTGPVYDGAPEPHHASGNADPPAGRPSRPSASPETPSGSPETPAGSPWATPPRRFPAADPALPPGRVESERRLPSGTNRAEDQQMEPRIPGDPRPATDGRAAAQRPDPAEQAWGPWASPPAPATSGRAAAPMSAAGPGVNAAPTPAPGMPRPSAPLEPGAPAGPYGPGVAVPPSGFGEAGPDVPGWVARDWA